MDSNKSFWQKTKDFITPDKKGIGIFPFSTYKPKPSRIDKPETFYDRSVYFGKAIDKRAGILGSVKFKAYRNEEEDEEVQLILESPNDLLSGDDFWQLAQLYYDLHGVYYIWKEMSGGMRGQKVEKLHLLHPRNMEMKFDKDGQLTHFIHKQSKRFEKDEIIFEHRPQPQDPTKPRGILSEGSKDVLRTEIELREYQKKIARSGGRINGVFSFDTEKGLSKKQIDELKDSYKQQIKDANNELGQIPFFLGGDANYMDLDKSPQEIQYLESQKAVLEEVSTITGVPKTILSSFDDVKFSNAEEARTTFLRETIKPLVRKRQATLNKYLAPEGVTIEAERVVPEDEDARREMLETANNINAMTLNEKREQLGLEPIDNGDKLLIPINLIEYEPGVTLNQDE